jgi:hypothetical protein
LLESFEKSERIRREQKELIHSMKKDLVRLRLEQNEKQIRAGEPGKKSGSATEDQAPHSRGVSPSPIINLEVAASAGIPDSKRSKSKKAEKKGR